MGNQKSIESRKSKSHLKVGKDAYLFNTDIDNLIGKVGYAQVFRAIRLHDKKEFALKRTMIPVKSMY